MSEFEPSGVTHRHHHRFSGFLGSRSLYWWMYPSRIALFVLLPIYVGCGGFDAADYALYKQPYVFLVSDRFWLGFAGLVAFAIGSLCVELRAVQSKAIGSRGARFACHSRLALCRDVGCLCDLPLSDPVEPTTCRRALRRLVECSVYPALHPRTDSGRDDLVDASVAVRCTPPASSADHGNELARHLHCPARGIGLRLLAAHLAVVGTTGAHRAGRAGCVGCRRPIGKEKDFLLAAEPRAWLARGVRPVRRRRIFSLLAILPCHLGDSFLSFAWVRFVGYYATALNNGALLYSGSEQGYILCILLCGSTSCPSGSRWEWGFHRQKISQSVCSLPTATPSSTTRQAFSSHSSTSGR